MSYDNTGGLGASTGPAPGQRTGPAAGAAAACAVTGRLPKIGTLGTAGAAAVGTGVCTYTARAGLRHGRACLA